MSKKRPEVVTATYRIVTPMFIGDAEQNATGISPASVKGALRFWWRALNWGLIRKSVDSNEAGLRELHKQEGELFGSAADKGPGQALFMLRVKGQKLKKNMPESPKAGTQYFLGQGLYNFKSGYIRKEVLSGEYSIECVLKSGIKPDQKQQLLDTIMVLGLLGGLGSRARKGFGSLSIKSMMVGDKNISIPASKKEYIETVSDWLNNGVQGLPPITAFSKQSRIDISHMGKNPEQLLNFAGEELQLYRSWGKDGKVSGKVSEKNFEGDHDSVLSVANDNHPGGLPKRAVFGMPHNYFFSSTRPTKSVDIAPAEESRARRASPLLIHIHQFPDGSSMLVQSLLPSDFLLHGEKVKFKARGKSRTITMNGNNDVDWKVIHKYMDRFEGKESVV